MNILLAIVAFCAMMLILVSVHEFGHFVMAKKFGVFCGEFSIGMGPLLWKHQGKETQYSLRALPIGGYVSMAGEEDDTKKDIEVPYERTINGIEWWKQIIVMLAGIFNNILFAWLVFILVFALAGTHVDYSSTAITSLVEGGVAESAGFEVGDVIVSLTNEAGETIEISSSSDLRTEINLNPQTFIFTVERDGELIEIEATPLYSEDDEMYMLGVTTSYSVEEITLLEAIYYGTEEMLEDSTLIFRSIKSLLSGNNLDSISGPVGIYSITEEAVSAGWLSYLELVALISLNLGIFNLLPIPALDGGRALMTLIEKIIGRPLNRKLYETLIYVGFFAIFALLIFATWNDILALFS